MKQIQWFPGHMQKTKRQMRENLKNVDVICEIVDARIPAISRNPDIDEIAGDKPRMMILNRIDLADPEATQKWIAYFKRHNMAVVAADSRSGKGVGQFVPAAKEILKDKIAQWQAKGQSGHAIRTMIVGIPNVGKSTFINRLVGKKVAKASDKPGVTRGAQWFRVEGGIELLDTPGILWPKFEDEKTGIYLASTGAIKDDILDTETLACKLMEILARKAPEALTVRYKIEIPEEEEYPFWGYEMLMRAGHKRGFLISGGEIDTERMAKIFLDEYRGGVLGRITLETPDEYEGAADES